MHGRRAVALAGFGRRPGGGLAAEAGVRRLSRGVELGRIRVYPRDLKAAGRKK